jgi:hypothetical protein
MTREEIIALRDSPSQDRVLAEIAFQLVELNSRLEKVLALVDTIYQNSMGWSLRPSTSTSSTHPPGM